MSEADKTVKDRPNDALSAQPEPVATASDQIGERAASVEIGCFEKAVLKPGASVHSVADFGTHKA
jgi:hypothetical protein